MKRLRQGLLLACWAAAAVTPAFAQSTSAPDSSAAPPSGAPDSITSQAAPESAAPRRTVGARLRHTAHSVVSDFGYVFSAPFRLKSAGFLWTVATLGATGVIYSYDDEILDAFHRSRGNEVYDQALEYGEQWEGAGFMGDEAPYWMGGVVVGTALHRYGPFRELQSISLDVLESHMITGTIRNSFKTLVGRKRPFEAGRASFFKHGTSTPSGHVSVLYEVATVLTRHAGKGPLYLSIPVGILGYGVGTAVAIQRIDSEGHWPSDVFLGAASGALIANTVARRNEERRAKDAQAAGSKQVGCTISPWMGPEGEIGLMVARKL